MSIMTFVLEAAILNAHALLNAVSKPVETMTDPMQIKSQIIHQLVTYHVEYKHMRASLVPISPNHEQPVTSITETERKDSTHMFFETNYRKSVQCLVCGLVVQQRGGGYMMFSRAQCSRGFHVNCFV